MRYFAITISNFIHIALIHKITFSAKIFIDKIFPELWILQILLFGIALIIFYDFTDAYRYF